MSWARFLFVYYIYIRQEFCVYPVQNTREVSSPKVSRNLEFSCCRRQRSLPRDVEVTSRSPFRRVIPALKALDSLSLSLRNLETPGPFDP